MSIILNISLSSEEKEKGEEREEKGGGEGRSDFLFFCGVKYEFANII